MQYHQVESGALAVIGYDAVCQRLTVQFRDGSAYEYRNVPEQAYAALLRADSRGRYFNLAIRGKYRHRAVSIVAGQGQVIRV
jgi:hypothetical protein